MQSEIFQTFICYKFDYGLQIWKPQIVKRVLLL